jgi:hypothetical protein
MTSAQASRASGSPPTLNVIQLPRPTTGRASPQLLQYESLSRYADAIRAGHEAIALFALTVPNTREERQAALEAEVRTIQSLIADRPIACLSELPGMEDAEMRMVMKLLTNLHTSCYLSGDKTLTILNTATMVRLSLIHGNSEESAYAYALYAAMQVVPIQRDFESAYEFGMLALAVNQRFHSPALRARVLMNLGWAVSLWRKPMQESIAISREAFRLGNDNGLFVEASYAAFNECWLTLLSARELPTLQKMCAPNVDYTRRVKMHHFVAAPQVILQWGAALQGLTEHPRSLTGADFDENAFRQGYRGQPLFEMFYFVAKLAVLYTCEEYRAAPRSGPASRSGLFRTFPERSGMSSRCFIMLLSWRRSIPS